MDTYRRFRSEMRQLRKLYMSSIYAYQIAIEDINANKVKKKEAIYHRNIREEEFLIGTSYLVLRNTLNKKYPRLLREIIFVRLISALEVYLIDSIAEIFVHNKEPFMSNDELTIHHNELLSMRSLSELYSKLLTKVTRDLHSQGFRAVEKYYRKVFKVDFSRFQLIIEKVTFNKNTIIEYHDTRHLIVHRLGQTDLIFRKKYETDSKIVLLDETYLLNTMKCISAFIEFVDGELGTYLSEKPSIVYSQVECEYTFEITPQTCDPKAIISDNFRFKVEDEIVFLQDIKRSISQNQDGIILITVAGERNILKQYKKALSSLMHKDEIQCKLLRKKNFVINNSITPEEIELVEQSLPPRPWERHIHKGIASKLGMSNSKISKIIGIIVENGRFSKKEYLPHKDE